MLTSVLFFLGSGVSYPAGIPSVGSLTCQALHSPWRKFPAGDFAPDESVAATSTGLAACVQGFLAELKSFADPIFRRQRGTDSNYEDLSYLVSTLRDLETGISADASQAFFHDAMRPVAEKWVSKLPELERNHGELSKFFDACDRFLLDVTSNALSVPHRPLGFQVLKDVIQANAVGNVDVVTTNHDLLLEKFIEECGLKPNADFDDGFDEADGELRFLNKDVIHRRAHRIQLIKLHGSVNWRYYACDDRDGGLWKVAIPSTARSIQCRDGSGRLWVNSWQGPLLVMGTKNKVASYRFSVFRKMDIWFEQALTEHQTIVLSGYGAHDEGLNARLCEWLGSSLDHRLVILSRDAEQIQVRISWASACHLDNRIIRSTKFLCEMSGWKELNALIESHI